MAERRNLDDILDILHNDPSATWDKVSKSLGNRERLIESPGYKAKREKKEARTRDKEAESVSRVMEFLGNLAEVESVMRVDKDSGRYKAGMDLGVKFNGSFEPTSVLKRVWIQVKSSDYKAREFVGKFGKAHLLKNKIIVLNGQDTEEEVVGRFWNGVSEIWEGRNEQGIR